jgi:hypothetical protein
MSKGLLTSLLVAAAVGFPAAAADAQDISLAAGQADVAIRAAQANAGAGTWLDRGALNTSDGRRDLVVGAPGIAGQVGRVYIINGGPEPSGEKTFSIANTTITGIEAGDLFGFTGALGNVLTPETSTQRNLVVGAPHAVGGRGAVYVFRGNNFGDSTSVTADTANFRIIGQPGDQLGSAIATADLDQDNYREIVVAARGTGRIYVIRGGPTLSGVLNLETQLAQVFMFGGPGFGSVLVAGDVTGDGLADIVVGAPSLNLVHVYRGLPAGGPLLNTFPDITFSLATAADEQVGASIQVADVDNDNIRDILIGAPLTDGFGRVDAGAVHVIWGGANLTARNPALSDAIFYGEAAGQQLGAFVSAGNANRDSVDDLLILAGGAGGGAGDLILYYGRSRGAFGVDGGGGRRIVDLASPANVDRKILGLGNPIWGQIRTAQVYELTGEGAGDIVVGVPGALSASGVVYFSKSPRFFLSSQSVGFTVNDFTVVSTPVNITNPSIVNVTWTASSNRAWLAVAPPSGNVDRTVPVPITISASSAGMPIGSQQGTITLRSTSKHLDMILSITVTLNRVPLSAPSFLTVSPGAGGLMLRWAPVPGATSYTVRRIDANGAATVLATGLNDTSFLDINGYPAAGVRYAISAANSAGEGLQSSPTLIPWGTAGSRTPTVMAPQDFDGDGRHDITIYRSTTGEWYTRRSSNGTLLARAWGAPAYQDQPVPADYDGDGKADTAIYRAATGEWFISRSSNGTLLAVAWGAPAFGDVPVPADYDGDGEADIAVYRVATGQWFISRSSAGFLGVSWGSPSYADVPVPGDYDGDGEADIAIYRGATGEWFVQRSSNGSLLTLVWGAPTFGDVPVPADYDGDGRTDIGVYRATTGGWFIARSGGGVTSMTWGHPPSADIPVPGDFDGDGEADLAVYRFATGEWFVRRSSNGAMIYLPWGAPGLGDTVKVF